MPCCLQLIQKVLYGILCQQIYQFSLLTMRVFFSKYSALNICRQIKDAMHESAGLSLRSSVTKSLSWLLHSADT